MSIHTHTHAHHSEEEIRSLWRLLAVLLHLGNLEYDWDETEGDPVTLSSTQVKKNARIQTSSMTQQDRPATD